MDSDIEIFLHKSKNCAQLATMPKSTTAESKGEIMYVSVIYKISVLIITPSLICRFINQQMNIIKSIMNDVCVYLCFIATKYDILHFVYFGFQDVLGMNERL